MFPSDKQHTIRSPLRDTAKQSISDEKLRNLTSSVDWSSRKIKLLSTETRIFLFWKAAWTRGFLVLCNGATGRKISSYVL